MRRAVVVVALLLAATTAHAGDLCRRGGVYRGARVDLDVKDADVHDVMRLLSDVGNMRVVILRMSRVTTIDATGAHVLADTVTRLEGRGVTVLLSGVRQPHEHVLRQLGVYDRLAHERHLFQATPDAIAHARVHAARVTHPPADLIG